MSTFPTIFESQFARSSGELVDELVLDPAIAEKLRDDMMASRKRDGDELLGFILCRRQRARGRERFIGVRPFVPHSFEQQGRSGIEIGADSHRELLNMLLNATDHQSFDLLQIHTHPGTASPSFSHVDDTSEQAYSKALHRLPNRPRVISGVMNETISQGLIRLWRNGKPLPIDVSDGFRPQIAAAIDANIDESWGDGSSLIEVAEIHERQRVFGAGAQLALGRLRIGVIGCGGIGAPFAETASRLGVADWVLIDPDVIETTNLNRVPFATLNDVRRKKAKVHHVARLIQRAAPGKARVRTFVNPIEDDCARKAISSVDLIVAATDNFASRFEAMKLGIENFRPVLSIATHVEKKPRGEPRIFARIALQNAVGEWCLACGKVIDLAEAALEKADYSIRESYARRGYVSGLPAPAVYWANVQAASIATGLIHGAIAGFVNTDNGVDWIVNLVSGERFEMDHAGPGCYTCANGR